MSHTNYIYGVHASLAIGLPCVILIALVMLLTGCATRNYADRKDDLHRYLSQTDAVSISSELNEPLIDKIIQLENRVDRLEDNSIGAKASVKTRAQFDLDGYYQNLSQDVECLIPKRIY